MVCWCASVYALRVVVIDVVVLSVLYGQKSDFLSTHIADGSHAAAKEYIECHNQSPIIYAIEMLHTCVCVWRLGKRRFNKPVLYVVQLELLHLSLSVIAGCLMNCIVMGLLLRRSGCESCHGNMETTKTLAVCSTYRESSLETARHVFVTRRQNSFNQYD